MKKISVIMLAMLLVVGVMAADKVEKCPKKVQVLTEKVAGQEFVEHVTFSGTLQPETVIIAAKVDGTVTALTVGMGDLVSQGFQLLELNLGLKEQIAAFEKELDILAKRLKTRQSWKERNPKGEAQVQDQITRTEGQIAALKQQAQDDFIYVAPFAGKILQLNVATAQEVKTGDALLVIQNSKKKVASLELTEDLAQLFSTSSYELALGGKKVLAEKVAYENGHMILAVADEDQLIEAGSSFSLTLLKKTHQDAVVVAESLVLGGNQPLVYVLEGEFAKQRSVTVLAREQAKVLIGEGLKLGDELVVAEIADANKSLLKEQFTCLKDAGLVVVMIKDEKKNRYVKRPQTAQAAVHQAKVVETPKEVVPAKVEKIEKVAVQPEVKVKVQDKCPKKVQVLTEKVAGQEFVEHVTFSGTLQLETATITAKADGTVTTLTVGMDDLVSQGFQLLELNLGLKDQLAVFEKELGVWTKRLKARQSSTERNPKAETKAQEQITRIEGQIAAIKQQAQDGLIYVAPFAGKVLQLNVAAAQEVKTGYALLVIQNGKKKVASLELTAELAQLFSASSYELVLGDKKLTAEKVAYENGHMVLAVADEDQLIEAGTSFTLTLVKETHHEAVVVAEPLVLGGNQPLVYVLEGELAKQRSVSVVVREEGKVLIGEGLKLGEEIIVAEIADAKKSQLKEQFTCLKEGGLVVVMVKDEKNNRLVKRPKMAKAAVHQAKVEVQPKVKVEQPETPVLEGQAKWRRFAVGVRGGLISSSYSYDVAAGNTYTVSPSAKTSTLLAGVFEFAILKDLSVGVELATLSKNVAFSVTQNIQTFTFENEKNFIEFSIYGKYHLPIHIDKAGKLRVYALLGLFYGSKSSGTRQYAYNTTSIVTVDDTAEYWEKLDAGLIGGLGFDYSFSPSFSLLSDFRYSLGTRELQGNKVNDIIKSQGLQFSLGGFFRF